MPNGALSVQEILCTPSTETICVYGYRRWIFFIRPLWKLELRDRTKTVIHKVFSTSPPGGANTWSKYKRAILHLKSTVLWKQTFFLGNCFFSSFFDHHLRHGPLTHSPHFVFTIMIDFRCKITCFLLWTRTRAIQRRNLKKPCRYQFYSVPIPVNTDCFCRGGVM